MRIRTIKPEWLLSESIASLSADARVLSVGLILMADDEGRGRAGLPTIVAEVWRYHASPEQCSETYVRAHGALTELSNAGFVRLYEVDGKPYFELPGFKTHQVINRPSSSKIPMPYRDSRRAHGGLTDGSVTEQGTGKGNREGEQGVCEKPSSPPPQPAAPQAPAGYESTHEGYSPGLQSLAEVFRKSVERRYELAKLPPPKECRHIDGAVWLELARWLDKAHKLRGWTHEKPDMAREMVEVFYASKDPRTVAGKHDISFLAKRPEEYLGLKVTS